MRFSSSRRAERSVEELRDQLASYGLRPHPTEPESLPLRALDPELEAIYERVVAKADKRNSRPLLASFRKVALRHKGWLAMAGATAVLALTVVVGLQFLNVGMPAAQADVPQMLDYEHSLSSDPKMPLGVPATGDLAALAKAASAANEGEPIPGKNTQYVSYFGWYLDGNDKSAVLPTRTETWLRPDGSMTQIQHRCAARIDGRGRIVPLKQNHKGQDSTSTDEFPKQTLKPNLTKTLSRDPSKLRSELLAWNNAEAWDTTTTTETDVLFDAIVNINQTYVVPSDLSEAWWTLLSHESGIRSLGEVQNRQGTKGIAIANWADASHSELDVLIVNPNTGVIDGVETISFVQQSAPKPSGPIVVATDSFEQKEWTTAVVPGRSSGH